MQIRVKIIGQEQIFVHKLTHLLIGHELIIEAITMRSLIVSLGDIFNCHGLGAMGSTDPVGIREVDADRCCRIGIAGKNSRCDHFRSNALHFIFTETGIHRRM